MTTTPKRVLARLRGILPPVVTPFNKRGDIDEGAFRANLQRYTGTGLAGVVVAGTTGEAPFLTQAERLRLTEIARGAMNPDELVVTGTGLESTRATIELSREAIRCGADVVLVVTPGYYRAKMDGPALLGHFRAVADAVRRPVLLYSIPQCAGTRMPVEVIAALARHKNIAGLKESSGDLAYARAILDQVPRAFRLFCGNVPILLEVLRAGGAGGIMGQACFAPELCVAFYNAWSAGDQERAEQLFAKLVPLAADVNVKYGAPAIKAAMDLLGYRGGDPRSPLLPVPAAARREIARTLKAHAADFRL
jgi:4-hydroxy-2-oxoglutarate aldolase